MSINSLTSYQPLTINGLDSFNVNGNAFDPTNYVSKIDTNLQNMAGSLDFQTNTIYTNVTATLGNQVPNKSYVDNAITLNTSGLQAQITANLLYTDTNFVNKTTTTAQEMHAQLIVPSLNLTAQTASKVPIIDASKNLVSSGVDSIKITYLDNVSSDIQTQLNTKATTTYVDSGLATKVSKSGDTMTGTLAMGANKVTSSYAPSASDDLTNKNYVDTQDSFLVAKTGSVMTGTLTVPSLVQSSATASTVPVFDSNKFLVSSGVSTTTLGYLDATSSIQTQLNSKASTSYVDSQDANLQSQINAKASTSYVDSQDANLQSQINTKASTSYVDSQDANLQSQINTKASTSYVDSQDALRVLKAGDVMTGTLTVPSFNVNTATPSRVAVFDASKNLVSNTVTTTELGYLSGVTSGIQSQINTKASTSYVDSQDALRVLKAGDVMTGTLTVPSFNVNTATVSTVPVFDGSKNLISSSVTSTELGYVSGVTSNIQTQINTKASVTYVDTQDALRVPYTGATTTVNLGAQKIQSSSPPTTGNDLCNLTYVNSVAGGGSWAVIGSDIYNSNAGNVGIGTTSPTTKLRVSGGSILLDFGRGIGFHPSTTDMATYSIHSITTAPYALRMALDSDSSAQRPFQIGYYTGNVASGAWNTKFGVNGYNGDTYIAGALRFENANTLEAKNSAGTYETFCHPRWSDNITYINYGSGGFNIRNNSAQSRMFLKDDGKVGIGTTDPVSIVEISSGNFNALTLTRTGATTNFGVGTVHSLISSTGSFRGYYVRTLGGSNGAPATTNQNQAQGYYIIDLALNGVFGSDSSPFSSSYVFTNGYLKCNASITIGSVGTYEPGCIYSDVNWGMLFRAKQSPNLAQFSWYSHDGNELMRLNPSGNLGIGTVSTNPVQKLTVNGGTSTTTLMVGTTLNPYNAMQYIYSSTADYTNSLRISTAWPSIFLDGVTSGGTNRNWVLLNGGAGAGILQGNCGFFDATANRYVFYMKADGDCQITDMGSAQNAIGRLGIRSVSQRHCLYVTSIGNQAGNTAIWENYNGITVGCTDVQTSYTAGLNFNMFRPGGTEDQNAWQGVITALRPSVSWLSLVVLAGTTYQYYYASLCSYTVAGGWANVSDEREKEDIQDLKTSSSLKRILAVRPKHYRRKFSEQKVTINEDGEEIKSAPVPDEIKNKRCIGFVAQELCESNPHCISEWENKDAKTDDDDGLRFGVNYNDYIVHLCGAVQEQQKQIEALQQNISVLVEHSRAQEKRDKEQDEEIKSLTALLSLERQKRLDFEALTEERFNKLASLLIPPQQS